MSDKQDYTVLADGWIAGKWHAKGTTVSLTRAEAKYENNLVLQNAAPAASAEPGQEGTKPTQAAKRSRARK